MLTRLNGMFAICILDLTRKCMFQLAITWALNRSMGNSGNDVLLRLRGEVVSGAPGFLAEVTSRDLTSIWRFILRWGRLPAARCATIASSLLSRSLS